MGTIFLNGDFLSEEKGLISIKDRSLTMGDGVFTTLLVDNGKIPFLIDHLKRIKNHASQIGIIPPTITLKTIQEIVLKNQALKGRWRLRITISGGKNQTRNLSKRKLGFILITINPIVKKAQKEVKLCVYPEPVVQPLAKVKTLAYLQRYAIQAYAHKKGFDDCIVRDCNDFILENSFANLFWIKDKTLYYPDPSLPYLLGITLSYILQAAKKIGLKIKPCFAKIPTLKDSAVYASNALIGFIPVTKIDKKKFNRNKNLEEKLNIAFGKIRDLNHFNPL